MSRFYCTPIKNTYFQYGHPKTPVSVHLFCLCTHNVPYAKYGCSQTGKQVNNKKSAKTYGWIDYVGVQNKVTNSLPSVQSHQNYVLALNHIPYIQESDKGEENVETEEILKPGVNEAIVSQVRNYNIYLHVSLIYNENFDQ